MTKRSAETCAACHLEAEPTGWDRFERTGVVARVVWLCPACVKAITRIAQGLPGSDDLQEFIVELLVRKEVPLTAFKAAERMLGGRQVTDSPAGRMRLPAPTEEVSDG